MAFKPNIYPVMYWSLAYGVAAGVLLFVLNLLSSFITIIWFPVFLCGLIWGGWRNYKKQKNTWETSTGTAATSQGVMGEFREAVTDIAGASQELFNQEAAPEEEITDVEDAADEELPPTDEVDPTANIPPVSPPTV